MRARGGGLAFYEARPRGGERVRTSLDAGENPPVGAIVYYLLRETPATPLSLSVLDARGALIRTFTTRPAEPTPGGEPKSAPGSSEPPAAPPAAAANERYITAKPSLNPLLWTLRYPAPEKVPGDVTTEKALVGPLAPPGTYQVRLTLGDQSWAQTFEVRKDPRVAASQADLDAQFALWRRISATLGEAHAGINRLRRIRRQVTEWGQKLRESPASTGAGATGSA